MQQSVFDFGVPQLNSISPAGFFRNDNSSSQNINKKEGEDKGSNVNCSGKISVHQEGSNGPGSGGSGSGSRGVANNGLGVMHSWTPVQWSPGTPVNRSWAYQ